MNESSQTQRLRDKNVVVIGGSRGLGRSIVAAVYAEGARVLAVARKAEPLKQLAAAFPGVQILALDATEEGAPAKVFELSHNLYTPVEDLGNLSAASPGELLFIDYWADPGGMETFFSNPFAQGAGDHLYSSREEAEWIPARDAFTFHVPAVAGTPARFVGMMRAPVRAASDTVTVLSELIWANLRTSRRLGHLSHQLFLRHAAVVEARPASNACRSGGEDTALPVEPVEVLAVDFWPTLEGLTEHYSALISTNGLDEVLAGPLTVSVWEQARGFVAW